MFFFSVIGAMQMRYDDDDDDRWDGGRMLERHWWRDWILDCRPAPGAAILQLAVRLEDISVLHDGDDVHLLVCWSTGLLAWSGGMLAPLHDSWCVLLERHPLRHWDVLHLRNWPLNSFGLWRRPTTHTEVRLLHVWWWLLIMHVFQY